ncbi:MAG: MarR family transcriptional regulator [Actinobacteria bacterium]|nr:MAG: MarR family transcriptional regulator [Actinomycetota bacterium]
MNAATATRARTPSATDAERLAADLRVAVARLARRLRQQTGTDLTASLLSALWSIERLEPVTLGDLAVADRVQPPTLTRIAARLEGEGLVVRRTDANDRRVTIVQLSPDGRRLLERTRTRRTAYLTKRLRGLDPEDLATLERAAPILERLAGEQA